MEMNAPRSRGRPPQSAGFSQGESQHETAAPVEAEAKAGPTRRRKRGDIGGQNFKLKAPTRPGFVRRWFNDVNNRLDEAQELAYAFVEDPSIKSSGEDSRVSRVVGTNEAGAPLRAYLMETPIEEYEAGIQDREEINRRVDQAITTGSDFTGRLSPEESYGHGKIERDR